jgi:hypothetical protein
VGLNSGRTVIQDSYLTECHSKGVDAQAIGGWNGPGPYKIVNNTLIGSGENILFGGADPAIPDLTPSDIEIRRNYIYTPPTWKGTWTRKNLIETKNAQRLLIEGNLLEGSWGDGQLGIGVIFKSSNQSGRCTWCATRDVTFRYNVLQKVGQPINLAGREGSNLKPIGEPLNRVLIEQNIIDSVNVAPYNGDSRFILLSAGAQNVIIRRNTLVTTGMQQTFMTFAKGVAVTNLVVESNVFTKGRYGMQGVGPSSGFGAKALTNAQGQVRFSNNVIVGPRPKEPYPASTMWASSVGQALGMGGRGATASVVWGQLNAVRVP